MQAVSGSFSWVIPIPNNGTLIGNHNLTLLHPGSSITYPSSAQMFWNIPGGADVTIATVGAKSATANVSLNGGTQVTVAGNLGDPLSSFGIVNRQVVVYYNNTVAGTGTTDSNGDFAIQVAIPAVAGNTTLFATFTANGTVYTSPLVFISTSIPTGFGDIIMQYLPWIIGIVAGIVGAFTAYTLYTRRSKKIKLGKMSKFADVTVGGFREKLKALHEGKRYREAIIFAYYTFLRLMEEYFDKPKRPSQTARDYAMTTAVKTVKLPPTLIYPFTSLFEAARYGKTEPTETELKEALELFLNLHSKIKEIPRVKVKEVELMAAQA
jgi:hypothetical protein